VHAGARAGECVTRERVAGGRVGAWVRGSFVRVWMQACVGASACRRTAADEARGRVGAWYLGACVRVRTHSCVGAYARRCAAVGPVCGRVSPWACGCAGSWAHHMGAWRMRSHVGARVHGVHGACKHTAAWARGAWACGRMGGVVSWAQGCAGGWWLSRHVGGSMVVGGWLPR
jgi:hypothetical protein